MRSGSLSDKSIWGGVVLILLCGWGLPIDLLAGEDRGANPLQQLKATDLGDRVRVEVTGRNALRYVLSSSLDPATVTLDLPGLSKGKSWERMTIHKPPLIEIIPRNIPAPRPGTQLMFRLTTPVEPIVNTQGNRLVLDFPKGLKSARNISSATKEGGASELKQKTDGSVAPAQLASMSQLAALVMTKVEIKRGKAETFVKLFGDGPFTYEAKLIGRSRLVVDLPGVFSALNRQVLPVDHPLLKRIRIGHHPGKVRLVFDLPRPVKYNIRSGDDYLGFRLTPGGRTHTLTDHQKIPSSLTRSGRVDTRRSVSVKQLTPAEKRRALRKIPRAFNSFQRKPKLAQMVSSPKEGANPRVRETGRFQGRRISLDFQDADISNVLRLIGEVSGMNLVIGQGVKAKVTMKLENVPWDHALDMLLKTNNLGMVKEGNIVWIDTLANISKQQDAAAKAQLSKTKAEPLVTRVIYIQNVKAGEIQTTLKQHLSPRGQLQVNDGTNSLVLQDTESKVAEFKKLVKKLDILSPQVQIEARIVQADTSFGRSLGIQWGFTSIRGVPGVTESFTSLGNLKGEFAEPILADNTLGTVTSDFIVNLPAAVTGLSNVPGIGFIFGKFSGGRALDMRLTAGELLGLTKVIAAPKIVTLDKQEAKIEQGESIPFQTTSLQGTQTTFVDANLTLKVTPQITSRDPREKAKTILMKVKATRNAVGARSNPAGPSIDKREATTQVLIRDGETVVIGGIFVDTQNNNVAGVPWLSRVPVLGWLFKNKVESVVKQELLIFLTPTIVT